MGDGFEEKVNNLAKFSLLKQVYYLLDYSLGHKLFIEVSLIIKNKLMTNENVKVTF